MPVGVSLERRGPLQSVLGVPPAGPVGGDVRFGTVPEGHRRSGLPSPRRTGQLTLVDRVSAVQTGLAAFERLLARLGEAHGMKRAEPPS
jgi:hypothetical protein